MALWERVSEERRAVEEGWVPEKVGGDAQGGDDGERGAGGGGARRERRGRRTTKEEGGEGDLGEQLRKRDNVRTKRSL